MEQRRVQVDALERFTGEILVSAGVDAGEAVIIAKVLAWNELIGRSTQGLVRLPIYLRRLQLGLVQSPCRPVCTQKSDAICMIDGHDGFGQYLGHLAMTKASELAASCGVGLVGVAGSNHFGSTAYYLNLAAGRQHLSLVTSNCVPKVAAHGGLTPVLGTNPIGFGAPTRSGQAILVDFSTGALAGSTIRKAVAENQQLPEGMLIDANERAIVDPGLAASGIMLPFGGAKGYGLGLMVEILSGVITGAAVSHEIGSIYGDFDRPSKVGHLFLAIDIARLLPVQAYYDRMDFLIGAIKESRTRQGLDEILLPGDTRWRTHDHQMDQGIALSDACITALEPLLEALDLTAPW